MGAGNEDNGNGKVTLAIIGLKLDTLLGEVRKLQTCQDLLGGEVQGLKLGAQKREEQISQVQKKTDELKDDLGKIEDKVQAIEVRSSFWNAGNTLGVVVAAVKAFLGGP